MFRKTLTHLIILALTVLPVQVISASVENSNMQMSMQQKQTANDCMHSLSAEQTSVKKSCCDDPSHQCENCNDCTQASSSAMLLPSLVLLTTYSKNAQKYFASYLFLNGVPQKNRLRPPRIFI